jgi:hypothetical protein
LFMGNSVDIWAIFNVDFHLITYFWFNYACFIYSKSKNLNYV